MSDSNRKDFSDKISGAVKPDEQKSSFEKVKESVSDTYDKAAAKVQPEEDKGVFQKISDSLSGKKD